MKTQQAKEQLLEAAQAASTQSMESAPWMAVGAFGLGLLIGGRPKLVAGCYRFALQGLKLYSSLRKTCHERH